MPLEANKWRFEEDVLVGYLADGAELHRVEIGGPSAVAKPTTTLAGHALSSMSIAVEDDTGKVFFYNEADGWGEMFTFKTAGGGAKSAPALTKSAPLVAGSEIEEPANKEEETTPEEPAEEVIEDSEVR